MIKNEFHALVAGDLKGALHWVQFDRLLDSVLERADLGWYLYDTRQAPPDRILEAADLQQALGEIARDVRARHTEDYCGIVYADDLKVPTFIKIYDPDHLGVVCGYSDNPPLPRWLLSQVPPSDIHIPSPGARRRGGWWPWRQ